MIKRKQQRHMLVTCTVENKEATIFLLFLFIKTGCNRDQNFILQEGYIYPRGKEAISQGARGMTLKSFIQYQLSKGGTNSKTDKKLSYR